MKTNTKIQYFTYCRKSSEDSQRQVASIGDQQSALTKLAEQEGLDLAHSPFTEERSAKDPGRPVFNEMLNRIKNGEANGLICWDIDRLSRNPIDNGQLQWMLQKGVIAVIKTPSRSFYPEDAGLLMSIEGGRATDFVMRLSKNVKRGLNGKAMRGWRPTGCPIGYLNVGVEKGGKTIISDPDRFTLIRQMWDLFISGNHTASQILEMATEKWGLRTLQRRKSGGKPLSMSHVYRILNDTFYYGSFSWIDPETGEEKMYKGKHEPMITEAEFWRAQVLLGKKGRQRPKSREFAFTGLMKCGECASGVTAEEKHQIICPNCKYKFSYEKKEACPKCNIEIEQMKNPKILHYTYYHCSRKKGPCSQKSVTVESLEEQFKEELKKITIDQEYLDLALDYLGDKEKNFGQEESVRRNSLQQEYDNIQTRLKNLNYEYISSQNTKHEIYSQSEFLELKNKLTEERSTIEKQLETVKDNLDTSIEATRRTFEFCTFALAHFNTDDLKKKRSIFSTIGSNLTLRDKKLFIDRLHPFLLIENELNAQKELEKRFEPKKKVALKRQNATFVASRPNLLGR